jgi:CRP-like cAMP-binding protein
MNPLIHKLSNYVNLPHADRTVLEDLSRKPERLPAYTDLVREGAAPDSVYLILTGWACRYRSCQMGRGRSWTTSSLVI